MCARCTPPFQAVTPSLVPEHCQTLAKALELLTTKESFVPTPCRISLATGGSPAKEWNTRCCPGSGRVIPLSLLTSSGVGGRSRGSLRHSPAPGPRGITLPACRRYGVRACGLWHWDREEPEGLAAYRPDFRTSISRVPFVRQHPSAKPETLSA